MEDKALTTMPSRRMSDMSGHRVKPSIFLRSTKSFQVVAALAAATNDNSQGRRGGLSPSGFNITDDDLLELGARYSIGTAESILTEIKNAFVNI